MSTLNNHRWIYVHMSSTVFEWPASSGIHLCWVSMGAHIWLCKDKMLSNIITISRRGHICLVYIGLFVPHIWHFSGAGVCRFIYQIWAWAGRGKHLQTVGWESAGFYSDQTHQQISLAHLQPDGRNSLEKSPADSLHLVANPCSTDSPVYVHICVCAHVCLCIHIVIRIIFCVFVPPPNSSNDREKWLTFVKSIKTKTLHLHSVRPSQILYASRYLRPSLLRTALGFSSQWQTANRIRADLGSDTSLPTLKWISHA